MNSDTGALVFVIVLWSAFFIGIYLVWRDKRCTSHSATDTSPSSTAPSTSQSEEEE